MIKVVVVFIVNSFALWGSGLLRLRCKFYEGHCKEIVVFYTFERGMNGSCGESKTSQYRDDVTSTVCLQDIVLDEEKVRHPQSAKVHPDLFKSRTERAK